MILIIVVLLICCVISIVGIGVGVYLVVNQPFTGRYIKLSQPTVGCLNIAEIEVYSTNGGKNIAPTATITKSSSYNNDSSPVKNLVDGNADTIVHTSCQDAGWVMLDFGKTVPIYSIVLTNRKDCCQARWNGLVLTILGDNNDVVYTGKPIADLTGSTSYSDSGKDAFMRITYLPPEPKWTGFNPF